VLVGRATRVQRFLMALPKTYVATARFGAISDTGDPDGEIVTTGRVPDGELALPTGELMQRPPAYSAVKVSGRRAYALARAGESPVLDARPIHVYRFEELSRAGDRRRFVIECSSGTYVRALIAGLGDAYCEELRRTRIGHFDVAEADCAQPVELSTALSFMPAVTLDGEQGSRVSHGQALALHRVSQAGELPDAVVARLIDPRGLVALATVDTAAGALRPIVGLRG
jgi:tRNA pseudouridine55 synthase